MRYLFSSDEYADSGNVPAFSYDAGADAYEQIAARAWFSGASWTEPLDRARPQELHLSAYDGSV